MLTIILIYLVLGVVVGVLAGLLGVGGGLIIVPMVGFSLTWEGGPSEFLMHLALGPSLASIIFPSVSSFWAHHKRGAVNWTVVRRIVLGILTGTFLGSCLAARMSTNLLKGVFVVFLFYMGFQMLTNKKPKPTRGLPGPVGYIVNGLGAADLPAYCLGYVYLPALAGIVAASVFTAPLGVRLAHSLPVGKLKRIFALLLFGMGAKMLIGLF